MTFTKEQLQRGYFICSSQKEVAEAVEIFRQAGFPVKTGWASTLYEYVGRVYPYVYYGLGGVATWSHCYAGAIELLLPSQVRTTEAAKWQPLTRGGLQYRIYATDGGGDFPIHGAVLAEDGRKWWPTTWLSDGREIKGDKSPRDLLPAGKRTVWLNAYSEGRGSYHSSKEQADKAAQPSRIACIKVEFEEGEGL